MQIRNALSAAAASAVLLVMIPLPAAAGPEFPADFPDEEYAGPTPGKLYTPYVEESYTWTESHLPAPPPVAVVAEPPRERIEVSVHVSDCAPSLGCAPAPLIPAPVVAAAPAVPVVRHFGYRVRRSRPLPVPPPAVALRSTTTWIKGPHGPRPVLVGGW